MQTPGVWEYQVLFSKDSSSIVGYQMVSFEEVKSLEAK